MKKLLHERLRECKRKTSYLDLCNGPGILISKQTAKELADEIERYYIPRPRDNMGVPYIEGDTVWPTDPETEYNATVSEVRMDEVIIRWEDGIISRCKPFDLQHDRPSAKVLDADGVEIKVGDTVWPIDEPSMRMTVDNFQCIYGQNITVNCEFECSTYNFNPEKLTHKEPDSLEKLCRDMMEHHENWDSDPNEWLEMATRLSALIKRDK